MVVGLSIAKTYTYKSKEICTYLYFLVDSIPAFFHNIPIKNRNITIIIAALDPEIVLRILTIDEGRNFIKATLTITTSESLDSITFKKLFHY